ncbi:hypothetical protein MUG91_G221n1 [Manis pentadactyla]|nr:hypothetical protein MUG91_G221n1 [Manis pentadactyla]
MQTQVSPGALQPPAPWISHSIKVEEYYQEKEAQSQWLKRIFEDKTASDATKSPPASQAETSAKPQAPPAPGPSLKPSVLFGTLNRPPANLSASAAHAVSSAHPMFKPIFVAPPKSGKEGPVPSSRSQVTMEASSSSAHTPTTSRLPLTFSPVFSSTELPTSLPLSTPSSFSQTTTSGTSMNTPLFPGPASVSVPSAVAWGTTTGTATDSAQKPVFGFGVSSVTSTVSSMTSPTASTAQSVLFGSPLASAASSAQPWAPYSSLAGSGHACSNNSHHLQPVPARCHPDSWQQHRQFRWLQWHPHDLHPHHPEPACTDI